MARVVLDMSMSVDGFIAGPDDRKGQGRRLFDDLPPDHHELELVRSLDGPGVLHLRYRVRSAG